MPNNPIIAVFDFRGKQDYIYKTNKIKEIMGASKLIEVAYDDALASYNKSGTRIETETDGKFSLADFKSSGKEGCILYKGGGNLLMLFRSETEFKAFTNHYSQHLIENSPGLSPICGSAELDEDSLYDKNIKNVFCDLNEYKRLAPPIAYADVLPVLQIDRNTSMPVTHKESNPEELSLSAESHAKRRAFDERISDELVGGETYKKYAKEFDAIVTKKGEESLLALIYADGNAMGQKVKDATNGCTFESGVNKMREFSARVNKAFVENTLEAICEKVSLLKKSKKTLALRRIIGGGDEITIICNARMALNVAKAYFESLEEFNSKSKNNDNFSACMGIAIFHSHDPFADIYQIAEECCENGKKMARKREGENCSYIDAYFCHGAVTGEMSEMRERQEAGRSNMPYRCGENLDRFLAIGDELNNIARTNVKALRDAAYRSKADFALELKRVKSNSKKELSLTVDDLPVFCDAAMYYDIWFKKDDTPQKEDEQNA